MPQKCRRVVSTSHTDTCSSMGFKAYSRNSWANATQQVLFRKFSIPCIALWSCDASKGDKMIHILREDVVVS